MDTTFQRAMFTSTEVQDRYSGDLFSKEIFEGVNVNIVPHWIGPSLAVPLQTLMNTLQISPLYSRQLQLT